MYSQEFIQARKNDLEKRKTEILKQLKNIVPKDRQSTEYDAEFPDFGDKEDENAAEVAAYEGNLSLEEDLKFSIERINKALHKIEKDKYGICEKCEGNISQERLEVFPQATACMNCKKKVFS